MSSDTQATPNSTVPRGRRAVARVVFLAIVTIAVVDVFPWGKLAESRPIAWTNELANTLGIWQGQWQMFAPNPSVNHYWLSAEIVVPDEAEPINWTSPYWPSINAAEKFLNFRSLNYYNRVCTRGYRHAAEDLADYLVRQEAKKRNVASDQVKIKLYANGLSMADPPEGEMPEAEEITWVTFSELAAKRDGSNE